MELLPWSGVLGLLPNCYVRRNHRLVNVAGTDNLPATFTLTVGVYLGAVLALKGLVIALVASSLLGTVMLLWLSAPLVRARRGQAGVSDEWV